MYQLLVTRPIRFCNGAKLFWLTRQVYRWKYRNSEKNRYRMLLQYEHTLDKGRACLIALLINVSVETHVDLTAIKCSKGR